MEQIDLGALTANLALARAPALVQALHLAAALVERDDEVPVVLATAQVSAERRPANAHSSTSRSGIPPPSRAHSNRSGPPRREKEATLDPGKQNLLDWVRERARLVPAARDRMAAIEAALDRRDIPARGPLADAELWALETRDSLPATRAMS